MAFGLTCRKVRDLAVVMAMILFSAASFGDETARSPLPQPDELEQARKSVESFLGNEPANGFNLLKLGRDTIDPAKKYVLLEMARKSGEENDKPRLVTDAIEVLAESFAIDDKAMLADSLSRMTKDKRQPDGALSVSTRNEIASQARNARDELIRQGDRYDLALTFANIVADATKGTTGSHDDDVEKLQFAQQLADGWKDLASELETLKADATNQQAHLKLGKFYCFVRGDWDLGLEHLAKGDDAELRELASIEQSDPTEGSVQYDLANSWYAYWKKIPDDQSIASLQVGRHARHWFEKAMPSLNQGFEFQDAKIKVASLPAPEKDSETAPRRKSIASREGRSNKRSMANKGDDASGSKREAKGSKSSSSANGADLRNTIGMRFRRIPAGTFRMGRSEPEESHFARFAIKPQHRGNGWGYVADEEPVHTVEISREFFLGTFEVTREQFAMFIKETGYRTDAERYGDGHGWDGRKDVQNRSFHWNNNGLPAERDLPVVNVSWNDADKFCRWLSQREGKKYRLPTEAEWEYCCRAGTESTFYNGDDPLKLVEIANASDLTLTRPTNVEYFIPVEDGFHHEAPVGRFQPNPWGLYDMLGNVSEWTEDRYASSFYADSPPKDPQCPRSQWSGGECVVRGGSWSRWPRMCTAADRDYGLPNLSDNFRGFRVLCESEPAPGRGKMADVVKLANDKQSKSMAKQDRFPAPVVYGGDWRVDGTDLIQDDSRGQTAIIFGDPNWDDYNLEYSVTMRTGNGGLGLILHNEDDAIEKWVQAIAWTYGVALLEKCHGWGKGPWTRLASVSGILPLDQQHAVKFEVRGSKITFFGDGKEVFTGDAAPVARGRIGFRTMDASAKFSDIKVTKPDGTVLWEGLPDVERARMTPYFFDHRKR